MLSINIQIIIIFGLCVIVPVIVWVPLISSIEYNREIKLIYAASNIISLIFFLVYVTFLYKRSTPIICDIVDFIFCEPYSPEDICLDIIIIVCFVLFFLNSYEVLPDLFDALKKLLCKFIRFLRKNS